jgi:hypothetical protein
MTSDRTLLCSLTVAHLTNFTHEAAIKPHFQGILVIYTIVQILTTKLIFSIMFIFFNFIWLGCQPVLESNTHYKSIFWCSLSTCNKVKGLVEVLIQWVPKFIANTYKTYQTLMLMSKSPSIQDIVDEWQGLEQSTLETITESDAFANSAMLYLAIVFFLVIVLLVLQFTILHMKTMIQITLCM